MIIMIRMFYIISFLVVHLSTAVNTVSGQAQMIDIKMLKGGDGGGCALKKEREMALDEIHQTVKSVLENYTCNGTPGWRRLAFVNMTDTSYNCPTGLNLTSYSKRTCGRSHTNSGGCSSTTFSVGDLPYSRVCGRIKGYQFGATNAFWIHVMDIDSYYVDGVSLTHGGPGRRQHIWTFAAGLSEKTSQNNENQLCSCDTSINQNDGVIPSFVGNDYFCETGLHFPWDSTLYGSTLFPNDPLWDGQNCTASSSCCQFNNPPWFTKNLPNPTTDDIELRICTTWSASIEDTPLELIELYVQ